MLALGPSKPANMWKQHLLMEDSGCPAALWLFSHGCTSLTFLYTTSVYKIFTRQVPPWASLACPLSFLSIIWALLSSPFLDPDTCSSIRKCCPFGSASYLQTFDLQCLRLLLQLVSHQVITLALELPIWVLSPVLPVYHLHSRGRMSL